MVAVDPDQWGKKWPKFTECRICGKPGEWYDSPTGSWWSHFEHPTDDHDFLPILHYTDPRAIELDPEEWWQHVSEEWDREALAQLLWRVGMPGYEAIVPKHPDWDSYLADADAIIAGFANGTLLS